LAYLLRKSKKLRTRKKAGKRIFGLMISGKKEVHFFWQRVLRKMCGYETVKRKKIEKG
jgi:hypothetical protein